LDYAQGYRDGYQAGARDALRLNNISPTIPFTVENGMVVEEEPVKKRKVSTYSRAYGRAYKALRRKHTLKSGKLRKGYTHKRLVKMAHAEAKRRRKK